MRYSPYIIIITLIVACSTRTGSLDLSGLQAYVGEPEHGLIKSRSVGGINTTVTLLPPAITALREYRTSAGDSCAMPFSSVLDQHDDMICFLLKLAPDGEKFNGDVMYAGASNAQQFKEQAFDLNFNWEHLVELRCNGRTYLPVLSSLENTYSLTRGRNIMLAFVPTGRDDNDFYGSEQLELIWRDDVFGTGIQHFRFSRADLMNVPQPSV